MLERMRPDASASSRRDRYQNAIVRCAAWVHGLASPTSKRSISAEISSMDWNFGVGTSIQIRIMDHAPRCPVVHMALRAGPDLGDRRRSLGYFLAPLYRARRVLDSRSCLDLFVRS